MVIVGIYHNFESVCNKLIYMHYFCRTLKFLLLHLSRLSTEFDKTGMTAYNLAIVWAPNILRRKKRRMSTVATQKDTAAEIDVMLFLIHNASRIFHDLHPLKPNLPTKGNTFC
jgi:hypothetical protein